MRVNIIRVAVTKTGLHWAIKKPPDVSVGRLEKTRIRNAALTAAKGSHLPLQGADRALLPIG